MRMGMKILMILMSAIVLISVAQINIIFAQSTFISGVEVEDDVINALENSEWVSVTIKLHDRNEIIRDSVISSLLGSEFRLKERLLREDGFSGNLTREGLNKLLNNSEVRLIYLNRVASVTTIDSLPFINATEVWEKGYMGKGQTICVIDTGINWSHSDLGGCFSSGCKVLGGYDYYNNDNNSMDDNGHGTHVAGIAAANGTFNGTAPYAKLIAMKACDSTGRDCPNTPIEKAITWCINNRTIYNISIISISIGNNVSNNDTTCPLALRDEINDAHSKNISVIISSGNNGYLGGISWPSCRGNVTSVGAVHDEIGNLTFCVQRNPAGNCVEYCDDFDATPDRVSCFTNRAKGILDLLAPGVRINSASHIGVGHITFTGTSMAAPHVAGAAALLLEVDPTLTPTQIRDILYNSGKPIQDYFDTCDVGLECTNLTFKRIDVLEAVNSLCHVGEWVAGSCGGGSCTSPKREYTRTVDPPQCAESSKCEYDSGCESGGGSSVEITVCASGCNSTTIQGAIDISDVNDKIIVNDSRTYNEELFMNSTTSGILNCNNGAIISGSGSSDTGIYLRRGTDGFIIKGCLFDSYSWGIFVDNSSHADIINVVINNSDVIGLLLKDDTFDVRINNLSVFETTGDNAVRYDGYAWSASIVSFNKMEDSIIKKSGAAELVWIDYGIENQFLRSNFSDGAVNFEGILFKGHNNVGNHKVVDSNIFNNYFGIRLDNSDNNQINNNTFCPSNTNNDFDVFSSTGNGGVGNRCDKPNNWNDDGTVGCTYSCDLSPKVTLLFPQNGTKDRDAELVFVCYSEDDVQLKNITLYTNINGSWTKNMTQNISGTYNTTTFVIQNVSYGIYLWNCLTYDNNSRSDWESTNWTVNVSLDINPQNITSVESNITNASLNQYVRVNCTAVDLEINVDTFLIEADKPLSSNENYSTTLLFNNTFYVDIQLTELGIWSFSCWVNDTLNNLAHKFDGSVNVSSVTVPNNTYKFYIRNGSNNVVAWLGNQGNIVLKGSCFSEGTCNNPGNNSFIIANATDNHVSFINASGDLCVEKGDCSDQSTSCNPTRKAFIIKNSSGYNMSYIDYDGDLCLIGRLFVQSL